MLQRGSIVRLDDIDLCLLGLVEDHRQALAALSEKAVVAVSTNNSRIKRLVRTGTSSGPHARTGSALEALGLSLLAHIGQLEQLDG